MTANTARMANTTRPPVAPLIVETRKAQMKEMNTPTCQNTCVVETSRGCGGIIRRIMGNNRHGNRQIGTGCEARDNQADKQRGEFPAKMQMTAPIA